MPLIDQSDRDVLDMPLIEHCLTEVCAGHATHWPLSDRGVLDMPLIDHCHAGILYYIG